MPSASLLLMCATFHPTSIDPTGSLFHCTRDLFKALLLISHQQQVVIDDDGIVVTNRPSAYETGLLADLSGKTADYLNVRLNLKFEIAKCNSDPASSEGLSGNVMVMYQELFHSQSAKENYHSNHLQMAKLMAYHWSNFAPLFDITHESWQVSNLQVVLHCSATSAWAMQDHEQLIKQAYLWNLQPSQSFKYRGISKFAQQCKDKHGPLVHLMITLGRNAGLAAAVVVHVLRVKCSIPSHQCSPKGGHKDGNNWRILLPNTHCALRCHEERCKCHLSVLVPAYDSPVIWDGCSPMATEMQRQLSKQILNCCMHTSDSCLIKVPVVALETTGLNGFYNAIAINAWNFTSKVPIIPSTEVEDSSLYTVEYL
ncbi:uncharacterized protein BJ212DRAFT_1299106 [Suillus subaureus]|uniref:Uncharacterized protein n=1 Tax=Suillus subaureus TaxID=48587 RepID=A0A9P7ECB1_9AGAM|nr:uncharacterized protein BJ212DRAFT_1299106 [Suillus subaureus]KAG1817558.1 hypothetical protein BJ212DRAFT_1299106 [Suillus subaureus]